VPQAIVPASLAGERIDRVVALVYDVSRSVAASLVEQGDVSIDGSPCTVRSTRVAAGDEVTVRAIPLPSRAPRRESLSPRCATPGSPSRCRSAATASPEW
jgi:ribosomal protein S4